MKQKSIKFMERLTKHWENNYVPTKLDLECLFDMSDEQAEYLQEIVKKLADYEDAEEQGLLLRLPCKVGDVVYYINFSQGKVEEDTVMEYSLETFDWYVRLRHSKWVHLDMFKINFYLTKEEAEQKLSEMKGV